MNLADIVSESIVDGPGFRMAVFAQGCPHHCEGCHNPQTHANVATTLQPNPVQLMDLLGASTLHEGITLTGGEPFMQARKFIPFVKMVRRAGYNVWAYSGYTFEELIGDDAPDGAGELLALCDVLVDGRFEEDLKSYSSQWRGSSNQRVIDIAATVESGEITLYTE